MTAPGGARSLTSTSATTAPSENSANWSEDKGLHPIHFGLHMAPGADERNITVSVIADGGACPY